MDESSTTTDVSLGDVYDTVSNGFDGLSATTSDGFVMVGDKLDDLLDHIQSSQATEGATTSGTVALDQAQVEMLQNGITVITTESFLLVVLLSCLCGLAGWIILSRGWFR
jgi:hypothetical protein